ncbi:hypothetical protein, partial [Actinocorallia aurantiaca]|uniref:hypothetical protein n=1 Tax=Actinocorallia aurantiaca TaxID=46204 RepID=UPI0031E3F024
MTGSPLSASQIIALSHGELARAADDYQLARRLQMATFVFAIISVFIPNSLTYIPTVCALVAQVTSWLVRNRAASRHKSGEAGRTWGLLFDAFGQIAERMELANWLSNIPAQDRASQGSVDPDYYASRSPKGVRRLCEHLQENAFWGKCLYRTTAARYRTMMWFSATIAIVAMLVAIPLASGEQGLLIARVIVVVLASGAVATQL